MNGNLITGITIDAGEYDTYGNTGMYGVIERLNIRAAILLNKGIYLPLLLENIALLKFLYGKNDQF
ncbi:hypothetical protein [Ancylomarina longa]|uniref:Uncharacterized protein n=1 Tax=Ancylomarina longa TaxID=2487017 RepID=A0A434AEZ2_9BACT|nr:hypothetical protein [Ancylomarina longa]RUT72939.1 hypothetical protein DLK05_15885 [Ancylomarina longa]